MKKFNFSKKFRLLKNFQFSSVFKDPVYFFLKGIIIFGKKNKFSYPRLGIIIPKKEIKLSSNRNRIKRVIREYFRLNKKDFPPMDFVVFIKRIASDFNNEKIFFILKKLWIFHLCFFQIYY
ncbi:hypothetical protein AOQ88_00465 [Candidatus Riesia sp. GBBU]|nr:hypothetical protein AOQ88_00465 [Candidatus Riesia sp. GBBU]